MEKHADAASAVASTNQQLFTDMTQSTIYLMGTSFILGALFTLFLLLVLDFVRRNKNAQQ